MKPQALLCIRSLTLGKSVKHSRSDFSTVKWIFYVSKPYTKANERMYVKIQKRESRIHPLNSIAMFISVAITVCVVIVVVRYPYGPRKRALGRCTPTVIMHTCGLKIRNTLLSEEKKNLNYQFANSIKGPF